ncbi:MAG: ribbon-helix-helix domain-containing protein [Melioribacteraceae bacterium]|nr:ribbon-helix-helix domain-containing protein [Melioribacteraceae bacterium]
MAVAKIAISIDEVILKQVDRLVQKKIYPSRSRAIQEAVKDKIERISKVRLANECAKLNSGEETSLAEEGMDMEIKEWQEY